MQLSIEIPENCIICLFFIPTKNFEYIIRSLLIDRYISYINILTHSCKHMP